MDSSTPNRMAYPQQLIDIATPEGQGAMVELSRLGEELFGKIPVSGAASNNEKINKKKVLVGKEIPPYLLELCKKSVQPLTEKMPEDAVPKELENIESWRVTISIHGRKISTVIKPGEGVLFRTILNVGDPEVYYLTDTSDDRNSNVKKPKKSKTRHGVKTMGKYQKRRNPMPLPNGFALMFAPFAINTTKVNVDGSPIRKDLPPQVSQIVPKIKPRNYFRCTVVMDLINS